MALSTAGMSGAGGGMTINPGTAFGGNALAAPQAFSSYQPPPVNPGEASADAAKGGGGAYDLSSWEKDDEPQEDLHACLGIDVGTSTIKASLFLEDGGTKPIGSKAPFPASILVDPKTGVKGIRRWLKQRTGGATPISSSIPKGVTLFYDPATAGKSGGSNKAGPGTGVVLWPLRIMALRGRGEEAKERVKSLLPFAIKVIDDDCQEDADVDTSGVTICITSPEASEEKDKELWCTPEEVLAMLLAGIKGRAEETHGVKLSTCSVSAPSSLGDLHRVALQRAVFLAGMRPSRFVSAPLATAIGYLQGRKDSIALAPEDIVVTVGMGASYLDVGVIVCNRETIPAAELAPTEKSREGKKKKSKGGAKEGSKEATEWRVKGIAGHPACGGLDMDYRIARALQAAVEDSSGEEIAGDSKLWHNLVGAASRLRERLSAEAKSSMQLKSGCCEAAPDFKHSVELSQSEMETAASATIETFRRTLRAALERGGVTPEQVKVALLYGSCTKTPAVHDEVIKLFPRAQLMSAAGGDASKGVALSLAAERALLKNAVITIVDAVPHKLGLMDCSKKGARPVELFALGANIPTTLDKDYSRRTAAGLAMDLEIVQWMEGDGEDAAESGGRRSKGAQNAGKWVVVQRLGNPLAMQDSSGYPVLAEEVTRRFALDEFGICTNEVHSSVLPKKSNGPGPLRRFFNIAGVVSIAFGVLGGGYWMLYRLEHAGERRQAAARTRLTAFYEKHNPDKLSTVEDALLRYKGREDVLFQRLKKQYGKPIPK